MYAFNLSLVTDLLASEAEFIIDFFTFWFFFLLLIGLKREKLVQLIFRFNVWCKKKLLASFALLLLR
jgi:hypothetical protein